MMLAINEHRDQELGIHQYAARGNVVVSMAFRLIPDSDQLTLTLSLTIQPGWHINANKTLDKKLIPTQLLIKDTHSNWKMIKFVFPQAKIKSLGFSETELALYEDQIEIKAYIKKEYNKSDDELSMIPVQLKLQACNEELCLPPEELKFNISSAAAKY